MHLVDTTLFFCQRGGGVKRYLLAKRAWLEKSASAVRHTLLVPSTLPGYEGILTSRCPAIALVDGYRFPLSVSCWRNELLRLAPDLIEAGDPYVPGWAARAVGQKLGIPVVGFFHSDMPRMLNKRLGAWTNPLSRGYLRGLYGGFDLVLAPSRAMLEKLEAWNIRNTALQPLGVDTNVFNPVTRDAGLRDEIGVGPDTRLLIYAGRFAREKNLPILINAVERLGAPYHLLLVGADRSARIAPRVTALPYEREGRRLSRLLASCDALVHAGDEETFGLILIEAMACGLPVVAVAMGATRELVDDTVGVLATRANAEKMAEAITRLFEQDTQSMGRDARERAVRLYSWSAALRQLLRHYATVTGEHDVQKQSASLFAHRRLL